MTLCQHLAVRVMCVTGVPINVETRTAEAFQTAISADLTGVAASSYTVTTTAYPDGTTYSDATAYPDGTTYPDATAYPDGTTYPVGTDATQTTVAVALADQALFTSTPTSATDGTSNENSSDSNSCGDGDTSTGTDNSNLRPDSLLNTGEANNPTQVMRQNIITRLVISSIELDSVVQELGWDTVTTADGKSRLVW